MGCVLVDKLGWFLQLFLGILAFFILIIKRYQETAATRRSWRIWSFDTSKQALVSIEIHFINVAIARAMMERGHTGDSCGWYFTMVLLDSTIGLVTVYFLLKWSNAMVHKHRIQLLYSGEYGSPARWRPWVAQLLLYNTVMLLEKGLVSLLLLFHFIQRVGGAILKPIGDVSPKLELVLALVITPFLINVMWFWIVDNFLMKAGDGEVIQRSSYKFSSLKKDLDEPNSPQSPRPTGSTYELSTFERLLEGEDDSSDGEDVVFSNGNGYSSPRRAD